MISSASKPIHQNSVESIGGTTQYQVSGRDSLRSIAVKFNTTTSTLMKLNKLSSNLIFPGQMLNVPELIVEEIASSKNHHQVAPSSFEGDYSFLAPLSASTTEKQPIESFIIEPYQNPTDDDVGITQTSYYNVEKSIDLESLKGIVPNKPTATKTLQKQLSIDSDEFQSGTTNRNRILSSESNTSDQFEENFLKMEVLYLTPNQESVDGVLLITPTSLMFDPNPSDPLAIRDGCDKYGTMCNMSSIVSATMFSGRGELPTYSSTERKSSETSSTTPEETIPEPLKQSVITTEPTSLAGKPIEDDPTPPSPPLEEATELDEATSESKLMKEFPLLYSIAQTVSGIIPGTTNESSTLSLDPKNSMFFCVRSKVPMMKTFSKNNNQNDKDHSNGKDEVKKDPSNTEDKLNESWFRIPKTKSDHLLAFFMQWTPDQHTIDFAEQNGFVVTNQVTFDGSIYSKENEESRPRSGTNNSLEFVEDFFSDSRIEKEWEILSIEEAKRRSTLGALEMANDDKSLMPEILDTSNLLNDTTILQLCKKLPARCIGCPWKLMYSTFEHGMSLRTLYRRNAKLADDHSTILIVQDTQGYIFGAVLSCRPQVSEHFCGTGESFLFTLEPNLEVFTWSGENMFFFKGNPDSLTIGGGDGFSGLWLDGDLCHGSSHACLTFNNTVLSSSEDFFVQGVEVWSFQDS